MAGCIVLNRIAGRTSGWYNGDSGLASPLQCS